MDAEPLRFVPVVCVIDGRLATGKTFGLAMPETARVRVTRTDANSPAIVTIARSTRDYFEPIHHIHKQPLTLVVPAGKHDSHPAGFGAAAPS